MSNDIFIREVNEELRQDRVKAAWRRFGPWLLGAAVLVVLATVGFVLWERTESARAAADGDRYLAALDLAAAGNAEGAVAGLEALAADGVGAYPELARLSLASLRAAADDDAGAVEILDAVAADASVPQPIRDVAAVRAGYLLVDGGSLDDVRARVERLSGDGEPLRYQAREALGLASWKAGDAENARALFEQLTGDLGTPSGISQRARLMLDVIAAAAQPASRDAASPAPPAAAETPPEEPALPVDAPPAPDAAPPAPEAAPPAAADGPPS